MKDCLIQILDRVLIFLHALLSHSDIKKVLSATKLQGRNEQLTHLLIYKTIVFVKLVIHSLLVERFDFRSLVEIELLT